MNVHFTKEDTKMVNKHMKKLLNIMETLLKLLLAY